MNLREQYRKFKTWQRTSYVVKPLGEQWHDCPTCKTHFQGNYCPRCGQSSKVGRISFKNSVAEFFDTWGIGNRSMTRTQRDLILRPGYMIRDYLNGMHNAYFPPFKMFFLLMTLFILTSHGLNIKGDYNKIFSEQVSGTSEVQKDTSSAESEDLQQAEVQHKIDKSQKNFFNYIRTMRKRQPAFANLAFLFLMSGYLYLFFRKSRTMGKIRFSEFFVALVYIENMSIIYTIVLSFFCLQGSILGVIPPVLQLIPLKQLYGYSYLRIILSVLPALVLMALTIVIVAVVTMLIA